MRSLTPIQSPRWIAWRDFRRQYLPAIVFLLILGATAVTWHQVGTQATLSAVAQGHQSTLASPWTSILTRVHVLPYQMVKKGDPIAILQPIDPRLQMDLLRSELDLARLQMQPSLIEQNAMNYERVRLEWMRYKAELAMAQVNLERAEKDLVRNLPLFQEKLLSADLYDLSVRDRDLYQAEVIEKSRLVDETRQRMEKLRPLGDVLAPRTNLLEDSLAAYFGARQSLLQTNLESLTLTAPIDGMVTSVTRQPSEYVIEGEPVVYIRSLWSERAVGYLRQPYPIEPRVGMPAQVTTRNQQRQTFPARVCQVGGPLEYITNALARIPLNALVDVGLPVVIELPPHAKIRPGEIVDVILRPSIDKSRLAWE